MAGHNKWSKVKNKKGVADGKKSKIWTKIIREITVASKVGGEDSGSNPRLRKALDDARTSNISKDTIQRALSRGSSTQDGADFEELAYEGYGPGGVAIIADCLTDNRNRTSGDVRAVFNKCGGNLGTTGSVSFGFKKKGQLMFEQGTEDKLLEIGLESGAEDVEAQEDGFLVSCQPEDFLNLKEAYEKAGFTLASAEIEKVPDIYVKITGDNAKSLLKLIDMLEDLDDVQNVWTNMDIDEAEMEKLAG